jgi:hypothetical protein
VLALAVAVAASESAAPAAKQEPDAYRGLGAWIDVYSSAFHTDAERVAATLSRYHVRTLFLETGNFRQRVDVVDPSRVSALIDAAHARGIAVVAWYLPSLTNPARDLRRALAAIGFTSDAGGRFDSFALDIESSAVADVALRTRRLLALSAKLRAAVGAAYPLGAIIPSPVGMQLLPHYWPGFPYRALARAYDVMLPMAYFSYRAHTEAAVARYVEAGVQIIRRNSGSSEIPIHVIGGLAGAASPGTARAFLGAVASCAVTGFSLYDYATTTPAVWSLLRRAALSPAAAPGCAS